MSAKSCEGCDQVEGEGGIELVECGECSMDICQTCSEVILGEVVCLFCQDSDDDEVFEDEMLYPEG